ncbi:hypothetical protein NP493_248g02008 [Ridgeia piscesae]|uniref:Uncharacterized protein n=1 Tax=Ridgeia piscesae TaxID=27915 RepID=A0AAD9NYS4_RIDPI|nr:hypothetical protein NP493_248g02008 [Ridgeia piscesae]
MAERAVQTAKRLLDLDEPEIGICYRRNRRHLQGVPDVLPPVPNIEPDDMDIQAEDPGEVLPPEGPGDEVELPVDVPTGLNKSAVYTRCGRAVRRPFLFVVLLYLIPLALSFRASQSCAESCDRGVKLCVRVTCKTDTEFGEDYVRWCKESCEGYREYCLHRHCSRHREVRR